MYEQRLNAWVLYLKVMGASLASLIGRRKSALHDPSLLILTLDDVPQGWERLQVHTYRTGLLSRSEPWAARLRAAHATSTSVMFHDPADSWARILSQAIPFASTADATDAWPSLEQRMIVNPDPRVRETGRVPLPLPVTIGDECRSLCITSTFVRGLGKSERNGEQMSVLWRRGDVLALVSVSGPVGRFDADDLVQLAAHQDVRIYAQQLPKTPSSSPYP
jgi:hypothetical protein